MAAVKTRVMTPPSTTPRMVSSRVDGAVVSALSTLVMTVSRRKRAIDNRGGRPRPALVRVMLAVADAPRVGSADGASRPGRSSDMVRAPAVEGVAVKSDRELSALVEATS